MSGGGGTTISSSEIPKELKDLFSGVGQQVLATQKALPLSEFAAWTPQQVAGLSPLQQMAVNLSPQTLSPLSGLQSAFDTAGPINTALGMTYQAGTGNSGEQSALNTLARSGRTGPVNLGGPRVPPIGVNGANASPFSMDGGMGGGMGVGGGKGSSGGTGAPPSPGAGSSPGFVPSPSGSPFPTISNQPTNSPWMTPPSSPSSSGGGGLMTPESPHSNIFSVEKLVNKAVADATAQATPDPSLLKYLQNQQLTSGIEQVKNTVQWSNGEMIDPTQGTPDYWVSQGYSPPVAKRLAEMASKNVYAQGDEYNGWYDTTNQYANTPTDPYSTFKF